MVGMQWLWFVHLPNAINCFGYKYCMRHCVHWKSEWHLNELSKTMNRCVCVCGANEWTKWNGKMINSSKLHGIILGVKKKIIRNCDSYTFTFFYFTIIHWCDNCYLSYFLFALSLFCFYVCHMSWVELRFADFFFS